MYTLDRKQSTQKGSFLPLTKCITFFKERCYFKGKNLLKFFPCKGALDAKPGEVGRGRGEGVGGGEGGKYFCQRE